MTLQLSFSSKQQKIVSTDIRELIPENNDQVVILLLFLDEDVTKQLLEGTDKQL